MYGATREHFDIYVLLPPVEFWAAAAPPTSGGPRSRQHWPPTKWK